MKLKVVIGLLSLLSFTVNAQPPEPTKGSTLTVYSDNHEKFVLVLDGKEQSTSAKDDIKIVGLDKKVYDGKIIFEDKSLPILMADMRVTTPDGTRADAYYNIRRTLDGTIELHFLSVVPINEKYLSNDLKYFAHKGGYGGQFIDYTAPIATKKKTRTEVINGQTVTVTASNTGFDLSGQPIKDKDVKFIDYSAPQAKETTSTVTATNAKGETITSTVKKIVPNDVYGPGTTKGVQPSLKDPEVPIVKDVVLPAMPKADMPKVEPIAANNVVSREGSTTITTSDLKNRVVVRDNVNADYINIQSSPLSKTDEGDTVYKSNVVVSDATPVVVSTLSSPETTTVTYKQPSANVPSSVTYKAPAANVTTTTTTKQADNNTTTTTVTETKPVEKTSDLKALAHVIVKSADNTSGVGNSSVNGVPESKNSKTIKKLFNSMSSYNDEKSAPAPPAATVDTFIENGKVIISTPATMPDLQTPSNASNNTTVVSKSKAQIAMDGNSTPYVNSADYVGYNSDGTRRISNAPCPNPMDVPTFDEAKSDLSALPDDGTKIQTAMMLENSYCFTAQQVFEICMMFTSERTKLEFSKASYSKTVDPNNYFKVNNCFQEESSIKELKDFLDKQK